MPAAARAVKPPRLSVYAPGRHAGIFGSGYVKFYAELPVLTIGRDTWSRQEVAGMGLTQTVACGILSGIAKRLGVQSLADMYERTSPYSFTEYRAGVATLYVLFAAFASRGLDPTAWYQRKRESEVIVTFVRLKQREAQAQARQKTEDRSRSRAARRSSHRRAVAAFTQGVGQ